VFQIGHTTEAEKEGERRQKNIKLSRAIRNKDV
jgi:hypothetical protein